MTQDEFDDALIDFASEHGVEIALKACCQFLVYTARVKGSFDVTSSDGTVITVAAGEKEDGA